MVYGAAVNPVNLGTRSTYSDIAAIVAEYLDVPYDGAGDSLWPAMKKECV